MKLKFQIVQGRKVNNMSQHITRNVQYIFLIVKNTCTYHKKRSGKNNLTAWIKEKIGINENMHIYSKYHLKGRHIKIGNTFVIFMQTNLKGKKLITNNPSLKAPGRSESTCVSRLVFYFFTMHFY